MIVVAGRAGSVDGLRLVRLVVEEVEVGGLLVQSGVGDGDADHGAGEFAKLAALVRNGWSNAPNRFRHSANQHTSHGRTFAARNPD